MKHTSANSGFMPFHYIFGLLFGELLKANYFFEYLVVMRKFSETKPPKTSQSRKRYTALGYGQTL